MLHAQGSNKRQDSRKKQEKKLELEAKTFPYTIGVISY